VVRPELSLVLPVFNEEAVLDELGRRLTDFLGRVGVSWEVVFVDDGSKDKSRSKLFALCREDSRFKLVGLSRNFGHQLAITAGMDYASGACVVVMDADLQDPPEVVAQMLEKHREGFDVVYGVRRKRRGETLFKRLTAAAYYRLLRAMVGVPIPLDAGDFRLLSRPVVAALQSLRETNRFVRGMVSWVGFRQTAVYYDRPERFAGETHYPLRKMVRFALDGIASFSTLPLRIAVWLGVCAGFIGVLVAVWAAYAHFFSHATLPGWTALMVAVCLASSAQLLMIGVLGEYVGRIYEEVKRRPLYIVQDVVNVDVSSDDLPPSSHAH
jgi:polyisoprenyl-phosphate glycosyltransferase